MEQLALPLISPITRQQAEATNDNSAQTQAHEVDSFPISTILPGETFTFTKETANRVRHLTHGLHIYPAKFIPQIPKWAIEYSRLSNGSTVLDPFCGCGTTLVESIASNNNAYGIDISPLAQLISKAKTTPLYTDNLSTLLSDVDDLISQISHYSLDVDIDTQTSDLNLHENWNFWFPRDVMLRLISIQRVIISYVPRTPSLSMEQVNDVRDYYLACLSSIIKRCSFFNEKEIKVRKDPRKTEATIPDPVGVLRDAIIRNLPGLIELSRFSNRQRPVASHVIGTSAQNIDLSDDTIDLIVTSPPYLNAIDYAMAHKYSLFVLNLVAPKDFKDHCRDYIGVTERAVRRQEYENVLYTGHEDADGFIDTLKNSTSPVDKIRAYIIYEYFRDMKKSLQECYRVLKPGSRLIMVLGDNVIRKMLIPTSGIVQEIAVSSDVGFDLETYFFHQLRNIRLKVKRNTTGGLIKNERIMVLRKP